MKKMLLVLTLLGGAILTGCDESHTETADDRMNQKQEQMAQEANRQTGMPAIKNFQRKKTLKAIIEAVDDDKLINYAYLQAEMTGKLVYIGRCQGYAISASTQYTNPLKAETWTYQGITAVTLPQADPDGLFSPASQDGSWLMMIDPETNEPRATYFEPKIVVSPFKLN
jgi:hypothetical protein